MALIFPSNPVLDQTYQSGSSPVYKWGGSFWTIVTPSTQIVLNASSASFAVSSSRTVSSSFSTSGSLSVSSSFAASSSLANTAIYSRGRYAYWAPYMSPSPSGMGATVTATNLTSSSIENGIQLTNTNSDGQTGLVNWSSTNIDWTKDFKMTAVVFIGDYGGNLTITGDGFVLYAGNTSPVTSVYGNTADNGLKFRQFVYNGLGSPNQAGSSFFVNTTKGTQGKLGNSWAVSVWTKYTVEVCTDVLTGRRNAVAYIDYATITEDYAGKLFVAAMDVTSWVPTGNNFGIFFSTGAARANQYINSITFEAL